MIEKSSGLSNLQCHYFIQVDRNLEILFTYQIASGLGAESRPTLAPKALHKHMLRNFSTKQQYRS
jgi:hypothetical protein